MNTHTLPSVKTLIIVWLSLMAATVGTMFTGKVTVIESIGPIWMGLLLLVTYFKATLILGYYLDLKSATGGWNKGFNGLVAIILVTIYVLYISGLYL